MLVRLSTKRVSTTKGHSLRRLALVAALVSVVSVANSVTITVTLRKSWFGLCSYFEYEFCRLPCCPGGFVAVKVSWPNAGDAGHMPGAGLPASPLEWCPPPDCRSISSGCNPTAIPADAYFQYKCGVWLLVGENIYKMDQRPVVPRLPRLGTMSSWMPGQMHLVVTDIPPSEVGKHLVVWQNNNLGPMGDLLGFAQVTGPVVNVPLDRPLIPIELVQLGLTSAVSPTADANLMDVPQLGVIYDSGPPKVVNFNGTDTYLGFSSGNVAPGLEQRWYAAPFVIPEGGATITQINADWFIPAGAGAQSVRYKIWPRSGFSNPGVVPIREGTLGAYGPGIDDPRVFGLEDWFHQYPGLHIELPQGEYYLTIYAEGDNGGLVQQLAWLTGANQDTIAQNNAFAWRAAQHPSPGFQVYNPPNILPTPLMGDQREHWNVSFQIIGWAYHHASTMAGHVEYTGWEGPNQDFIWRLPLQERNCGPVYAFRYSPIVASEGYRFSYSGSVSHHINDFEQTFQHRTWLRRTLTYDSDSGDQLYRVYELVNGDTNGDNEIDIGDYANLSAAFGSTPFDPNWNPMCDFNGDEEVNIGDYAILSQNFGEIGDC